VTVFLGGLPVIAFVLGVLLLGNARPGWGWDRSFLRGTIFFASYAVIGAEILSLFQGLTLPGLVALWLIPILALGSVLVRWRRKRVIRVPRIPALTAPEGLVALLLAVVILATAAVAYLAPPNTWDSFTYHMARVAHWAQAGSLEHYATGIERQNLMPPAAEIGMLQAYVLAQGDRLVNFPQWLAMVGSLVAVGSVARLLSASRLGQLMAAIFLATLPMGIAQATSTMTDYVVTIWILCVAVEAVSLVTQDSGETPSILTLGLAAGLAIATKPTSFAFLAPVGLVVAIVLLRRRGVVGLLNPTVIALALLLALNAGHMGRNIATYGHPLGSSRNLELHANRILDWKVVVSNVTRNASLHAVSPWKSVNEFAFRGLVWIHLRLGLGLTDPRTTESSNFPIGRPPVDETRSGNPAQAIATLALVPLLGIAVLRGDGKARLPFLYLIIVAVSFVILSSMIRLTAFSSRYHVPFFALVAPTFGFVTGRWRPAWIPAALALGLTIAAGPWLLSLHERPLLEDSRGYSVLTSKRESLYFTTGPGLEEGYERVAEKIQSASCSAVGVMLGGEAAEYPLWPLLGDPRSKTRLEWIVAGTPSARYSDPSFEPCAVVCDGTCPAGWTEVRGLPWSLDIKGLRLYISPVP